MKIILKNKWLLSDDYLIDTFIALDKKMFTK